MESIVRQPDLAVAVLDATGAATRPMPVALPIAPPGRRTPRA